MLSMRCFLVWLLDFPVGGDDLGLTVFNRVHKIIAACLEPTNQFLTHYYY